MKTKAAIPSHNYKRVCYPIALMYKLLKVAVDVPSNHNFFGFRKAVYIRLRHREHQIFCPFVSGVPALEALAD